MDFEKEIYNNPKPTLVMVGASWCPPCKFMKPLFNSLQKEWAEKVNLHYLDVDIEGNKDFAQHHDVKTMPCFIMFHGWVEVARLSGRQPERAMVQMLTEHS
jgi:thioredoxin 1